MKLAKIAFLVTDENMGLCLYIEEEKFKSSDPIETLISVAKI